MSEEMLCPECLEILEFRRSSFEQYQPSVYWCKKCKEEYHQLEVRGFNHGFKFRLGASNATKQTT